MSVLISVRSVVVGIFANIFRNKGFRVGEFIFLTISGSFPGGQLESKRKVVRRRDNCDGTSKAYSFSTLIDNDASEATFEVFGRMLGVSEIRSVGFDVHWSL